MQKAGVVYGYADGSEVDRGAETGTGSVTLRVYRAALYLALASRETDTEIRFLPNVQRKLIPKR